MKRTMLLVGALWLGMGPAGASESAARNDVRAFVHAAFAGDDFEDIDERYTRALASGERTRSGAFLATLYIDALRSRPAPSTDGGWRWVNRQPKSVLAAIALAVEFQQHGHELRTKGKPGVSMESAARMAPSSFHSALHQLQRVKVAGTADPHWHAVLLALGGDLQWPREKLLPLADEATKAHPGHLAVYQAVARVQVPQRGGSFAALHALADQAVRVGAKADGQSLYARVFWAVDDLVPAEAWRDKSIDWARVRAGFNDLVRKYPDPVNLNSFARLACKAGDRETARRILPAIQDKPDAAVWGSLDAYNQCQAFVGVPAAAAPPADETAYRKRIADDTRLAFLQENFPVIEARYRDALARDLRTPSGVVVASIIARSLRPENFRGTPDVWRAHYDRARRWREKDPGSVLAALAIAQHHIDLAWTVRGSGYANTVTPENWKVFHNNQAQAREEMDSVRAAGLKDANWRAQRLHIAFHLTEESPRYWGLVRDSIDAHPHDYEIYFAVANYLLPQWGGSMETLDAFAEKAVERTRAKEGNALYARIFWRVENNLPEHYLRDTPKVWGKVRAGFEDVLRRYPAPWNTNAYARMACAAADKAALKDILGRIGDGVDPAAWTDRAHYLRCRRLAGLP